MDEPANLGGYIDAHSHVWSRDVERFPLAAGVHVDEAAAGWTVRSWTAEELLEKSGALRSQTRSPDRTWSDLWL